MASEWFPKPFFLYLRFMLKAQIRKQILVKRKSLSKAQFLSLNQLILAHFIQWDFSHINAIHIFLPILKNNEPNTFLWIDWLSKNQPHIQIVISKSDFKNYTMTSHPYLGKNDLIENQYGIPEPKTNKLFTDKIDMVLIPLLAFDKRGYRVGYGKGFYDRFLVDKQIIKLGISLFDGIDQIDDVHEDDIRLDYCITPNEIIKFEK